MKRCPTCNKEFTNENDFCFDDGTRLLASGSTEQTVVFATPSSSSHYAAGAPPVQRPPYLLFGVILLLAVAAAGFGVAYFVSPKSETASTNQNSRDVNARSQQQNEEKSKLELQQAQVNADAERLAAEKRRLETEKQKIEQAKQASGPLPPSTLAWTVDPPTNIRVAPNGKIKCVISTPTQITIINTPSIQTKTGAWYRTTACGGSDVVHSSQITFR